MLCLISLQGLTQVDTGSNPDTMNIIEEDDIRRAVEDLYIKGLQIRDFGLIRAVCIPETKLMGIDREGKLNVTSLDKWALRFDPENPPFEKLDHSITKIDRSGTAAQVKIVFLVNSQHYVTDYLNMLKIDGTWKIVNIIDY